jgi:hypothetical protein
MQVFPLSYIPKLFSLLLLTFLQVFPAAYIWTSYPIASILECLKPQVDDLGKMLVSKTINNTLGVQSSEGSTHASFSLSYTVEVIAMLERVANYGQTGNVRVFCRRLMDQFLLSASPRFGAMPMWSNAFSITRNRTGQLRLKFPFQHWPVDEITFQPLTASDAALRFHYNPSFAEVSISTLIMVNSCFNYYSLSF